MNVGLLLLRTIVGLTLAAHAPGKLSTRWGYGPDGTGQFLESLGFKPGRRFAQVAGLAELIGGLLLVFGIATPLAAAIVASVMLVAAATVHYKQGFFAAGGGYEFNLVLGGAAIALAFTGPGAFSVDGWLGYGSGTVATGLVAIVIAVIGTIAQLAQRSATPAAEGLRTAA